MYNMYITLIILYIYHTRITVCVCMNVYKLFVCIVCALLSAVVV